LPELTSDEFAAYLAALRPDLLRIITSIQKGTPDDADDALAETTLFALELLPKYSPKPTERTDPYPPSLLKWLTGIARFAILKERDRAARRPATVPIDTARNVCAPPDPPDAPSFQLAIDQLPEKLRTLVHSWNQGYSQSEIARYHGIAYNTAGNRLELAFEQLRMKIPREDEISYNIGGSDLVIGSRVTIYRKPVGVWRSWVGKHPPDYHFGQHVRRQTTPRRIRQKGPA
jgi:DNA-directed RNA polymerase specialized sigma24 family protein